MYLARTVPQKPGHIREVADTADFLTFATPARAFKPQREHISISAEHCSAVAMGWKLVIQLTPALPAKVLMTMPDSHCLQSKQRSLSQV